MFEECRALGLFSKEAVGGDGSGGTTPVSWLLPSFKPAGAVEAIVLERRDVYKRSETFERLFKRNKN